MEINIDSTKKQLRRHRGTRVKLSGLTLIVITTIAIGIALACGAPISPWWLLAPITSPFAVGLAGIALAIVAGLTIFAALVVGGLVVIALALVCLVPVLLLAVLYVIKEKIFG